jgi:hypothetical protein
MPCDPDATREEIAGRRRKIEQRRRLRDDDVDGDTREKSRRHRRGKETRDPAQPRKSARDQDRAHAERECRGQRAVCR